MLDDDIKGCNATPCMERPDRSRTDQMVLNVEYQCTSWRMIQCARKAADAAAKGTDQEPIEYTARMLELALDGWADVLRKLMWNGELQLQSRCDKNEKVMRWLGLTPPQELLNRLPGPWKLRIRELTETETDEGEEGSVRGMSDEGRCRFGGLLIEVERAGEDGEWGAWRIDGAPLGLGTRYFFSYVARNLPSASERQAALDEVLRRKEEKRRRMPGYEKLSELAKLMVDVELFIWNSGKMRLRGEGVTFELPDGKLPSLREIADMLDDEREVAAVRFGVWGPDDDDGEGNFGGKGASSCWTVEMMPLGSKEWVPS